MAAPTSTLAAFTLVLLTGCGSGKLSPGQQQALDSAVQHVEAFKNAHGNYPERDEFHAWLKTNQLSGVADYDVVTSGGTNAYRVHVWLGERMRVYYSERHALGDPETK
jgi:hypothetical protein